MKIEPLLVEQRRISDQFRVVESAIQEMQTQLAKRRLDLADRTRLETGVATSTAELMRLGQLRLELDASVTAAAFRAR
jgi:hypothetical protein